MTLLLVWFALGTARADIIVLSPCESVGKPCVMQGGRRTDGRSGLSGPGICTRSSSGDLLCLPDEDPPECWTPDERRGVWSTDGGALTCVEPSPKPKQPPKDAAESGAAAPPHPAAGAAEALEGDATFSEPVAPPTPQRHAPSDRATAPTSAPPAADVVPAGCGCGTGGAAGSPLVGLLLLLLARHPGAASDAGPGAPPRATPLG